MSKITFLAKRIIRSLRRKELIEVPKSINAKHILEGKIALITGGNSGIGFAMAQKFLDEGARVIIAGTNEKKLKSSYEQLGDSDKVRTIVIDVSDVTHISEKVESALNMFPERRIDILVNSAGVPDEKDFFHTTEKDYDRVMDINMKGTFFMSQAVAAQMIEKKIKGHILNLASASSKRPAWTPYQISKWGVRGFTLGLADTLIPYGIVVNAIAPGPTGTPFFGMKNGENNYMENQPSHRYAYPSEIAELAAFMVSDHGNLIVGDTYFISGGSGITTLHN
ncbi:MAG: SDR family oxidoreductase [Lachnospiraceae bacterium]|nr:SDR family oxidoreductase [Lachnospiraceae bacterium]